MKASDYATLQTMQQEFPRSQLADWDASIRAWLRAADEAKMVDQRQLMLIINNINLPVSNNINVYRSVLDTWKLAMVSMNNLVTGVPQRVQDGALLLGLSAWHPYPDMVVYGAVIKEIRYKDLLVETGGILTIGLQNDDTHDVGIYWSLPLAHLRYYGDPVQSVRTISQDSSRVSIDQLAQVALEALFSSWAEPTTKILNLATWFSDFAEFLCRVASNTSKRNKERRLARTILQSPGWMEVLINAAKSLLVLIETERESSMRLVALGMRRCPDFLAQTGSHPSSPFFGLSNPIFLLPMLVNEEERIHVLRNVAQNLDIDKSGLIIRYRHDEDGTDDSWYEYASALPYDALSRKRDNSGDQIISFHHKRWIAMRIEGENLKPRDQSVSEYSCGCVGDCVGPTKNRIGCPCATHPGRCTANCSCFQGNFTTRKGVDYKKRERNLKQRKCYINESYLSRLDDAEFRRYQISSEDCSVQTLSDFTNKLDGFRRMISLNGTIGEFGFDTQYSRDDFNLQTFLNIWERKHEIGIPFIIALKDAPWDNEANGRITGGPAQLLFGDTTAAIFRLESKQEPRSFSSTNCFHLRDFTEIFSRDALDVSRLCKYLQKFDKVFCVDYTRSLKALASAADVYKLLPNATVDLGITTRPLHKSSWVSGMADFEDHEAYSTYDFRLHCIFRVRLFQHRSPFIDRCHGYVVRKLNLCSSTSAVRPLRNTCRA
jgi:hypothetical protein